MQWVPNPHPSLPCLVLSPLCSLPGACLGLPAYNQPSRPRLPPVAHNSWALLFTKYFLAPDFHLLSNSTDFQVQPAWSHHQSFQFSLLSSCSFRGECGTACSPCLMQQTLHTLLTMSSLSLHTLFAIQQTQGLPGTKEQVPRTWVFPEPYFAFLDSC